MNSRYLHGPPQPNLGHALGQVHRGHATRLRHGDLGIREEGQDVPAIGFTQKNGVIFHGKSWGNVPWLDYVKWIRNRNWTMDLTMENHRKIYWDLFFMFTKRILHHWWYIFLGIASSNWDFMRFYWDFTVTIEKWWMNGNFHECPWYRWSKSWLVNRWSPSRMVIVFDPFPYVGIRICSPQK